MSNTCVLAFADFFCTISVKKSVSRASFDRDLQVKKYLFRVK